MAITREWDMDDVVYEAATSYANEKYGWELSFPVDLLKYRAEERTDGQITVVVVFNRGGLGCPKLRISLDNLLEKIHLLETRVPVIQEHEEGENEEDLIGFENEKPLLVEKSEAQTVLLKEDPSADFPYVVADFTQMGITKRQEQALYHAGFLDYEDFNGEAEELLAVSGIGQATAEKILAFLEKQEN